MQMRWSFDDKIIDKKGKVAITKEESSRCDVVNSEHCDCVSAAIKARQKEIGTVANKIIDENIEAFSELAN